MEKNILYERDLLYPTDNINDPGSIHVEVFNPSQSGKMPILIESKSGHSPIKYMNSILRIMQIDIFDRIHIEVRDSAKLFIKVNDSLKQEFASKYVQVVFSGEKVEYTGVEEV